MSLMGLFLVVCVIMVLTVLIQRPQGGGLAGAFGSGAGSGQTAFGTKTGDALTWMTVGVFVIFLLIAIVLNAGVKSIVGGGRQNETQNASGEGAGSTAPEGQTTTQPTTQPSTQPDAGTQPAPVENKPAEATPAETKPVETKPAESKPAEAAPTTPAPTTSPAPTSPTPTSPTPTPAPKP
jgi:protein translocase SecG subunit